jgi:ABC-type glycerol-3-phosphate transport system permease component
MITVNPTSPRQLLLRLPVYAVMVLLTITMIIPFWWMFTGAFKPVPELLRNPPTFIIENPTLNNFYDPIFSGDGPPQVHNRERGLFQRFERVPLGFGTFYLNSIIITSSITILSLLIASAAAFVLAKQDIPGGRAIFLVILSSMMLPWQITLIPNFLLIRDLGWLNTYQGYIVPALTSPFAVFFLRQYTMSLPDELFDAARIDGASEFRIWWQIILPLTRPAIAAMAIFAVNGNWNNLVTPLIIAQTDSMATLPLALQRLVSLYASATTMGVIMAGALLMSLPTLIFFLLFQKEFIQGIAITGLKG